jgi:hypothetical protein
MSAPEAAVANRENATSPLFAGHYPSSKVVTPNTRSSRNGGIAPVYMRAVSNTGTSPRSCANATASRLMLGTSRKIFPPADAGQQSRWDHLGGGAVVGHQRADFATLAAWTDHAPADKPAIAHKGATDMPGRADPGAQERGARSRKHRRVVRLYSRQRDFGQRQDASLRCIRGRDDAAVTDVGIRRSRHRRRGRGSSLRLRPSSPLSRFRPAASFGCLDHSWRAIVQMDS